MATWSGWAKQLLTAAGVPTSADNVQFMQDWNKHASTNCQNNPVDISLNVSGASPCKLTSNPQRRARNYASHDQAAGQFAAELHSGDFPNLLTALHSGTPYNPTGSDKVSADLTKWGSAKFGTAYTAEINAIIKSGGTNAPHAHHGWGDLRHSVNHNMPAALRAARKSQAAALRSLSHARKVGG